MDAAARRVRFAQASFKLEEEHDEELQEATRSSRAREDPSSSCEVFVVARLRKKMRRALLRCALALASLPAARSEGGGVDGLISNVIDTATPGLQKAVDLAPGININQADMDRFKAEKGKVDAVTTRVERYSQSRPLGKPGEGLDCVYRMRGAGLKAINQYRYTQLPDTGCGGSRRAAPGQARRRRRR